MQLNPYVSGNPLKDRAQFFGRENIMRDVMQMLRHPEEKAIVLFGQRRIGKTSILLQLVQLLSAEGQFAPVFFDLQDQASLPLEDVLFKLAQTIAASLEQPAPERANFDKSGEYFQKRFLPQMATHAGQEGLVILFDEFDVMDSPQKGQAAQAFFPYLRGCLAVLEKVKFVFVIGRRPEELSTDTLSTFKGIRAARVSLLDHKATEAVVRQSEVKHSLAWSETAVERVWSWTQGHTYCTQLVCSAVWESLQEMSDGSTPQTAQPGDVDQAIPEALKNGANAFHWIWDGLPPAERVVMAAMAEATSETIRGEDIEEILNRSGVRLVVRELKLAPATLVDWELLRPVNGGYRVTVPLLREWVRINRPLTRTKDELDRLDPLAENLYRAGQSFYSLNQQAEAIQQLRQALTVNPNHLKSRLLLGRILLEQGKPENIQESVQILEEAYRYDSSSAAPDLVKSLLANADQQTDAETRINIYNRILSIQPGQPTAADRLSAITQARQQEWTALGEKALEQGDFTRAIQAFEKAGATERIEQVRMAEHLRWVEQTFTQAVDAAALEDWETVQAKCSEILERRPDHTPALDLLNKAMPEAQLARLYRRALDLLTRGQVKESLASFLEIIAIRPAYKKAARYLDAIVQGEYGSHANPGVRLSALSSAVVWAGLVLAVEYGVYALVVTIGRFSPLYDLYDPASFSAFLLFTAIPSAPVFPFIHWLRNRWSIRRNDLTLDQGSPKLVEKLLSEAVILGLSAGFLSLVYASLYMSFNWILKYAASKCLCDLISGYPGDIQIFFLISLLPGGIGYLALRVVQKRWGAGVRYTPAPSEPPKPTQTDEIPSLPETPAAGGNNPIPWGAFALGIYGISLGILYAVLSPFFSGYGSPFDIVLILIVLLVPAAIDLLVIRLLQRGKVKKTTRGI
jgi:tetratricopeptide (TPR) repeat protein